MTYDGRPPPSDERDQAWFERLFREHHAAVLRYAFRRVPGEADDVVAEVFATAWRRRADVPAEPLAWLYRTAGHQIQHAQRGAARRYQVAERAQQMTREGAMAPHGEAAPGDLADQVVAAADGQSQVRRALARLKPQDAEILRLWGWEELDARSLGEVLGCRAATARVRLHRAMRRLERALDAEAQAMPGPIGQTRARGPITASTLAWRQDA